MRKACLIAVFALACSPAGAQGFFLGGAADGAAVARDQELRQRALELDRRYGGDAYEQLRQEQRLRDLERALDKNNRLLREERARRGWLLPPLYR